MFGNQCIYGYYVIVNCKKPHLAFLPGLVVFLKGQ